MKRKQRSKFKYKDRKMRNNIIIKRKNEESPREGKQKQKVLETCLYNWRSLVKHIIGPGISKNDQAHVKTHSGATTDDIIDYVKPKQIASKQERYILPSKQFQKTYF